MSDQAEVKQNDGTKGTSQRQSYDTVVQAIDGLKSRGYSLDFNLSFDQLICHEKNVCLSPAEFEITEVHRFEGATNPSDEDVVYAVESRNGEVKGVLTAAFGPYADGISPEMMKKISMRRQP